MLIERRFTAQLHWELQSTVMQAIYAGKFGSLHHGSHTHLRVIVSGSIIDLELPTVPTFLPSKLEPCAAEANALTRSFASFLIIMEVHEDDDDLTSFPSRRASSAHIPHRHILPNPTGIDHRQVTPFC
jgi:hypothetical protein